MKTIFLKIYYKIWSFFMNLNTADLPATVSEDHHVNWLIMKIEPILYDYSLTDAEKVNKLKHLIDGYDILEY